MECGSTIVSAFDDRNEAELAVTELEQAGIPRGEIGFAIRGQDVVAGGMITDAQGTKDGSGAVAGATAGGIVGGVIGAAAAALIPGIGPVIAGGILTTALGGVAAGAATGGILGALSGLGVSEDEAQYYQRMFESGKAIVTVRAGEKAPTACQILENHGGYTPQMRH
jgi:hypothetical protein